MYRNTVELFPILGGHCLKAADYSYTCFRIIIKNNRKRCGFTNVNLQMNLGRGRQQSSIFYFKYKPLLHPRGGQQGMFMMPSLRYVG